MQKTPESLDFKDPGVLYKENPALDANVIKIRARSCLLVWIRTDQR